MTYEDEQRASALAACESAEQDKINFCNAYVDQTRAATQALYNNCQFLYQDARYIPEDDVRFEWCFNLKTGSPNGDPNYQTNGQDPVKYLKGLVLACRLNKKDKTIHIPR